MKKVLLATTMLAGTAGFASAEVAISGYAEIGIWSNVDGDVAFHQDVEVTFNMSGTTDGGLEFGAKIDLDEGDVALNDDSGTEVWISGAFGKLTMGDTDGAMDWALADMGGGLTSLTDDHTTHVAYFGATGTFGPGDGLDGEGDGQVVRYENTIGGFSFAVSAEQIDDGSNAAAPLDDIFGIGVKYTADMGGTAVNLGAAYQTGGSLRAGDNFDVVGVSAGAELAGGFGFEIGYMDFSSEFGFPDFNHTGVGLTYKSGPIGVNVNYGVIDPDGFDKIDSWGVAANYDLGGGAVVMFGYGSDMDVLTAGDQDQWSLGLGLSF